MKWHLLNQLYVHSEYADCHVSLLEEALSSELQLVQVLVSGIVSSQMMLSRLSQEADRATLEDRTLELI